VFTCLQKSMNLMTVMTCKFSVSVGLPHFLPYQFIIRNCDLSWPILTAWPFTVRSNLRKYITALNFLKYFSFPIFSLLNNVKPTHYPTCIRHMMFSHHNISLVLWFLYNFRYTPCANIALVLLVTLFTNIEYCRYTVCVLLCEF